MEGLSFQYKLEIVPVGAGARGDSGEQGLGGNRLDIEMSAMQAPTVCTSRPHSRAAIHPFPAVRGLDSLHYYDWYTLR